MTASGRRAVPLRRLPRRSISRLSVKANQGTAMPTPAYITIEGSTQGPITQGAFTEDSVGNVWQEGHEDEILVQQVDHVITIPRDPQSGQPSGQRVHRPMKFTAALNKATPLLYNALTSGEMLTKCELKWYRTNSSGTHLYACGDGGQIYKRDDAKFGDGAWAPLAPKLLQRLSDRPAAMQAAPGSPEARAKIYFCVNGPSEQEIYICGAHGVILCWDGHAMHEVPSGTTVSLINILVRDERTIYICGRDGTLLRGNRRDGFLAVPGFGGGQGFTSMTLCSGKLYLGSNSSPRGLFVYDGGLPRRVSCGMVPDIEDVNVIDSADDVLWVVGSQELLRFDGKSWERIDYPDNDPIGQPSRGGSAAAPTGRATSQPPDPIARFAAMQDFPNAMARRINCYGMGDWLEQLLGWLGQGMPDAAAPLQEKIEIASSQRDVRITLYRILFSLALLHAWSRR
jgi:hypothetical protein